MNLSKLSPLFAVLVITGCGSSYSATLTGQTPMPDGSSLTAMGGSLHTGIATAFTPQVEKHDPFGDTSETDGVLIASSNPGVVRAASVTGSSRWIVWAVSAGAAELTITQDGNVAQTLQVVVTDPP